MAVVGALLNNVARKRSENIKRKQTIGPDAQIKTLKKLLTRARNTQFGMAYGFEEILSAVDPVKQFQQEVPIYNYETIK